MRRKRTTSAIGNNGERKYKCSGLDQKRRVNEEKFLQDLRKKIYPLLDIPTWRNIVYPNAAIFDIVAKSGLRYSFIEDTSNSINRKAGCKVVPDADTVYYRLKKLTEEEWTLKWDKSNKKMMQLARKQRMIPLLPSISIDITPIMFYGNKDTYGVRGTRPKKGSHWAFEYMTACFSDCAAHFTPSAIPLKKGQKTWDALEVVLLDALQYVNRPFLIYMDRWFYSTPVIDLMEKYGQKYLMPAKKTAPVKRLIEEHEAPCVLPYTVHGKYGTADTTLVLVEDKNGKVKAFATNLKVSADQAKTLFDKYENRWTVDTSYRMVGQVRMNAKTVNYVVRWFLFFFGLLIKNGYWLFNDSIKEYDHVTLITFAEMFIEVEGALFDFTAIYRGRG
ncbi:MAG: transposase [Candidatus Methanofastidiosia archaeon]